jgi:O-antigen/teichoic acid export membrane protein
MRDSTRIASVRLQMLATTGLERRSALFEILGRVRLRLVGRIGTLASAIALQAILSVALLPLATKVLSAADYGTYALFMSIIAIVGAAADGGAGLLLPAHYGPASALERGRLFASLAVFACSCGIAGGLFLITLWFWRQNAFSGQPMSLAAIALSAALMPMRAITNISVGIFSVTGRSLAIAAQIVIQAVVVFVSTLAALFIFSMEGKSLFIGAICGQFAALCVGIFVLRHHRELSLPSFRWFRRVTISAPTTGASGFVDGVHGFGENAMLAGASGPHAVGILSHARVYYSLLIALACAVGHNVWARSLEEARNPHSRFEMTLSAWTPVQIAFAIAGIVFAPIANEIVKIIGSGKFPEAAVYIPAFFVMALIQITEQPASAVVFAANRSAVATRTRTIMMLGGLVLLYPTILMFGLKGVVAICITEGVLYRQYLRLLASRERNVPFQDHVAVFGAFTIIAETACVHWMAPSLGIRLALMAVGIAMLVALSRRSVSEMISTAHQIGLGRPA